MSRLEAAALAAVSAERALIPVSPGDIMQAEVPAPRFVLQPLIPRRLVTLLGGHGGAGKSVLALAIVAHVAAGKNWAGLDVVPGSALFVSLEDPADVVRFRLRKIIAECELDAEAVAENLLIADGTAGDAALAREANDGASKRTVPTSVYDEMAALSVGRDLIVIDNASDGFDGSENDRRQVRAFMRMLVAVARDNDAAVLLLAHIDKQAARFGSQGNSYSGSTAWHNSARSRLALVDTDGVIELLHEKHNHSRGEPPIPMRWTDSGVLVPMAATKTLQADDAADVLRVLQVAAAQGVDVGAARTGPTTAQTVLATFPELPERLRGTKGRRAFWAAVSKLQDSGKVRIAEVRTSHRNMRKVFIAEPPHAEVLRGNPPHPLCVNAAHRGAEVCGGLREFDETEPPQTPAPDEAATAAYRAARDGTA